MIARALQVDPRELYDVLANDQSAAPSAAPAGTAGSTPQPVRDDSWHENPTHLAAIRAPAAIPRAGVAARERAPEAEIVAQAVELLSQLAAPRRLEALAKIQTRVLQDLVDYEVQQSRQRTD